MAKQQTITHLLESLNRAKERLASLQENPDTKRITSYAKALEESERRCRALETEILSVGLNEQIVIVKGKYKKEISKQVFITGNFVAIYPDGPLDLLEILAKQDFEEARELTFETVKMRSKLSKLNF